MNKVMGIVLIIALVFSLGCTQNVPDTNVADNNNTALFILGGDNMANEVKVKDGDNVSVHYIGKLENGEQFDSSVGKEPLAFTVGVGQMIKGFDAAVIGMKVGDKKTITIIPEEGYGVADPSRVVTFDKNDVPDFEKMEVGMQIPAGNGMLGVITSKDDKQIIVDFNHFLAGKKLVFDIEIVSIN